MSRTLSENDLRWFAARLLIAVEDTRKFGPMSVHDMRQALRDIPGAESLTLSLAEDGSGDEVITIAGRTVRVRPGASHDEIALAFREPAMSTPNVTVTPLPEPVAYAPITRNTTMTKPATGGFAASIRAMMDEARAGVEKARADGLAQVGDAVAKLNEAKAATAHVANKMAATIKDEADSVLAELGQISNDLGNDAG